MDRSMAGWMVAALLAGMWLGGGEQEAHADVPVRVMCKAFYQDFPNGMVSPERAVEKATELGGKIAPWLESQFAAGADGVQIHSFVPFGVMGGAELLCVRFSDMPPR